MNSKILELIKQYVDHDMNLDFEDAGSESRNHDRSVYIGYVGLANELDDILKESVEWFAQS